VTSTYAPEAAPFQPDAGYPFQGPQFQRNLFPPQMWPRMMQPQFPMPRHHQSVEFPQTRTQVSQLQPTVEPSNDAISASNLPPQERAALMRAQLLAPGLNLNAQEWKEMNQEDKDTTLELCLSISSLSNPGVTVLQPKNSVAPIKSLIVGVQTRQNRKLCRQG